PVITVAMAVVDSSTCSSRRRERSLIDLREISAGAGRVSPKHSTTVARLRRGGGPSSSFPSPTNVKMLEGNVRQGKGKPARQGMPVNAGGPGMHEAATGLGGRGIEQVGSDGRRRVNAKDENQERRHQRAAADARHPDKHADAESRSNIKRIDHVHTICSDICG